ncbi:TolC family protein [Chthonobacter albigriseus]|uniref:TolC family protein n=1 Tax=Chthonobacter albigriseus TaxID=1683161 RepID=UPI001FCE7435|nr:TolC family protein [Chthonobacter albigriseus]
MQTPGRHWKPWQISSAVIVAVLVLGGCSKPARDLALRSPAQNATVGAVEVTGSIDRTVAAPGGSDRNSLPGVRAGRLSTADLVSHVLATNPDIGIATKREQEQTLGIELAGVGYRPKVDFTASMGPEYIATYESEESRRNRKEIGLGLHQTIYDFGVIDGDIRRASAAKEAASNKRFAQIEATTQETAEALLQVLELDEQIRVAKGNVAAHQTILDLVKTNEKDGNASVADIKRVTTRLENAKTSLIDLTTERSDAADSFRRLTDISADDIDGRALLSLKGGPADVSPEVLEANPALEAIRHEIVSLRAQIDSVRAGRLPSITFDADAKIRDDVGGPTEPGLTAKAMINVQMKLIDGGEASILERQLMTRIEEAMLKLDKQRRELKEAAENAARLASSGGEKAESLSSRLDASRKVAELYLEQFKAGGVTIFELLDSQADRQKAEADAITQAYEQRRSHIQRLVLAGKLSETLLGRSQPRPATADVSALTP